MQRRRGRLQHGMSGRSVYCLHPDTQAYVHPHADAKRNWQPSSDRDDIGHANINAYGHDGRRANAE